jgi:predicted RNase H-like nuclease
MLKASISVVGDGEIDDFIFSHVQEERVSAAIDAPLIVKNATGQRPCEREISRNFQRFDAGAHSSNLSRPLFSPEPRGLNLAKRWNWSVDPADRLGPGSSAIEVYPHPAMVSLFGLERVIPYKYKRRRSVAARKTAFDVLFGFMEQHLGPTMKLSSNARWSALKNQVAEANRQVDLDRVEDEVDGIFCAYLAWLWDQEDSDMVVFGDVETGYIVSPPAPSQAPNRG